MKSIIINMFGGPCAGKTKFAAKLTGDLIEQGYLLSYVTEYVQHLYWEERHNVLEDQLYILAKQNRKLKTINGKVRYIISDSPLLLSAIYGKEPMLCDYAKVLFNSYTNWNFYIERQPGLHRTEGRYHGQKESEKLDEEIYDMLIKTNTPFVKVSDYETLFSIVQAWVNSQDRINRTNSRCNCRTMANPKGEWLQCSYHNQFLG